MARKVLHREKTDNRRDLIWAMQEHNKRMKRGEADFERFAIECIAPKQVVVVAYALEHFPGFQEAVRGRAKPSSWPPIDHLLQQKQLVDQHREPPVEDLRTRQRGSAASEREAPPQCASAGYARRRLAARLTL